MSKSFKYWQQGDCLLKPATIPSKAVEKADRVLIEGEHTGHAHRIQPGSDATIFVLNEMTYLRAFKDTIIEHEEHGEIPIPMGDYQIDRVRDYDHFREEARAVAD